MFILKIIGFILLAYFIYSEVLEVNRYTYKQYRYEFFNTQNFVITVIGYVLLFIGDMWYADALKADADILNGQVLMALGAMLVIYVVYTNITNTTLLFGIVMSSLQLLLYIPLSVLSMFILVIVLGFAAETKPVYVVNQ
ncbi:MAG: hypothetical protein Q9M32_05815 [Sulfurimonas sp.]|nr:hypothetical protein [Sulfurimonas sp.]MDQ7060037.1 hypothetical protein [Sulfurimonas sp.]